MNFNLGDKVTHDEVYNSKEVFEVVGIRATELELRGDWSGGTHTVKADGWMKIEGIKLHSRALPAIGTYVYTVDGRGKQRVLRLYESGDSLRWMGECGTYHLESVVNWLHLLNF